MVQPNISIYNGVTETKGGETLPFDLFLEGIRTGKWQDIVLPIRTIKEKKERDAAKKKAPIVTLSGSFNERKDDGLNKHSSFIGIDIDDVSNPEDLKKSLAADKYIVAAFTSISGRGLCLVFHISGAKHREAFQGINQYLYDNYDVICDPTSINVSRARFVSYDPHIYISVNYDKFLSYPKVKPPKKIEKTVFEKTDFDELLKEICGRRLNLCEDYHDWLRIGFALSHKFAEQGREYFHIVSQYSSKYQANSTDKQYTACLKHKGGTEATIATFYYYCKQAGIQLYSERTRKIVHSASHGKKGGLNQKQVAENLKKFEQIEGAEDLIQQVYENDISIDEDGLLPQLELWLRQNYELRRNLITRYIENNGKPLEHKDFNSIFISAKKIFPELSFELMDRLINSDFVPTYNPFFEFFESNKERKKTGCIEKLFSCIQSKDAEFVLHFGRKWLVGIISAIHGEHSPLMLILTGETQNTGKTEFFRRLLPTDLKKYYAESKLDAGKDDEILMTQKALIMDDEMGGKSKKENKRLKELTSKQTFSLREPYGRNNVDLVRLAVLCGTSNDNELLNDPTGNRRIIPVQVYSINHDVYNSVDKTDLLMEAYWLWKEGFEWKLDKHDIEYLGIDKISFEVSNFEKELLQQYFEKGDDNLTATEIMIYLEAKTKQRLIIDKIGKELKALGFEQKKIDSGTKRVYCVSKKIKDEPLPF
jgi:hypothetical protein